MPALSTTPSALPRAGTARAALAAALALAGPLGCVATGANELGPLREEVSSLRQAHDRDRKRLEALELEVDAQQVELRQLRGGAAPAAVGAPASAAFSNDPSGQFGPNGLPVVRLQPRAARDLPPLPTGVPVREPPPELLAELERPPPAGESDGEAPGEAETLFKSAFEKLKTGELVGSAAQFHSFAQRFPKHPAADNALLDEGIAYYGLRRYQEALDVFQLLAARYPAGDAVAEGLLRAGDCQTRLGDGAGAERSYRSLLKHYPASPEATRASALLALASAKTANAAAAPTAP